MFRLCDFKCSPNRWITLNCSGDRENCLKYDLLPPICVWWYSNSSHNKPILKIGLKYSAFRTFFWKYINNKSTKFWLKTVSILFDSITIYFLFSYILQFANLFTLSAGRETIFIAITTAINEFLTLIHIKSVGPRWEKGHAHSHTITIREWSQTANICKKSQNWNSWQSSIRIKITYNS